MSWTSDESVDDLIALRKYDQAIELLEERLHRDPKNIWVRLRFGDVLVSKGQKERAAKILLGLVDQLASDGLIPKAVAVLKKLKRMEPQRTGVEEMIVDLFHSDRANEQSGSGAERSPLFSDFSREELLDVIRGLELRSYDSGAILMTEGEPGDSLFVLTSGTVRTFVKNGEGKNVEVRRMEEGAFFGEISLLSGKPRTATITAATSCELLELDRTALDEIAARHPRVRTVVAEFYAQRAGSESEREARSS